MRVTNTSGVEMRVRGIEGVIAIGPGKTASVRFTEDQLTRARGRSYLDIEGVAPVEEPPVNLTAKHRGAGSYSIMDDTGKEILSGMSKEDAEAFNVMSAEDKAAFVVGVDH